MSSTGETYRPKEHDGLKEDGNPDKRVSSEHGFGGSDGPDPHVEGQKGGKTSDLAPDAQSKDDGDFDPEAPKV